MTVSRFATLGGAIAMAIAVFTVTAEAQTSTRRQMSPQDQQALQDNCAGDYLRFCGQYSPDGPEVEQCFKANNKELSPGCQTAIKAYNGGRRRRP